MYPKVGNLAYTSPQLVKVANMHAKHHKAVAERTIHLFHTSSCSMQLLPSKSASGPYFNAQVDFQPASSSLLNKLV